MLSTIYEKVSYDDQDDDDGPEDYVGITKGWFDGVIILFVVIFVFSCTTINNYRQSLHFKKNMSEEKKNIQLKVRVEEYLRFPCSILLLVMVYP
jgi:hypothetical protein